jgi:hypothetical protein
MLGYLFKFSLLLSLFSAFALAYPHSHPILSLQEACDSLLPITSAASDHDKASALYNEAFRLSFANDAHKANQVAKCAAFFDHGSKHWKHETKKHRF